MSESAVSEEEPLTPMSLGALLGRVHREWTTRQRIFDLPSARICNVGDGPDLSADFLGRPIATPLGPAAGPHTQLAQNIVLAWLAGGRLFELKTVQILDELVIKRPCIDVETVGYNIEWSQELKVEQSLEEYVKASMMLEILAQWEPLAEHLAPDPGPHVFDLSVGYDLEGVSSPKVADFIASMMSCGDIVERLRSELTGHWERFADYPFSTRLSDTLTLSTFHGCPPEQIESITKHLITDHGLNVIVKLNPTLLGYERVESILHDTLGFAELELQPVAFEQDLQFDRALELIGELQGFAERHGKAFGIKLTNTLIVNNHRGLLPEDSMYLSGAPLHVLAMTLLSELHRALPGKLRVEGNDSAPVQVSWSAGITRDNVVAAASLGLVPITVCSDLLKPGGYGRLALMTKKLRLAVEEAVETADLEDGNGTTLGLAQLVGGPGSIDQYLASLYSPASNSAYTKEGNMKLPRSVEHVLEPWGCVACNFCVTVCPNDAFLKVRSTIPDHRWEYLVLGESCNDCGNCNTFCPEDGDPAKIKPKLFFSERRFGQADRPSHLVGRDDGDVVINSTAAARDQTQTLRSILEGEQGLPF